MNFLSRLLYHQAQKVRLEPIQPAKDSQKTPKFEELLLAFPDGYEYNNWRGDFVS
jgi:hypothetical protein